MNLIEIETLRTKEELINYFERIGQSITEEEIDQLKKSYEEAEEATSALTLEQLDDVVGGVILVVHPGEAYSRVHYWKNGTSGINEIINEINREPKAKSEKMPPGSSLTTWKEGTPVTVYDSSRKFDGSYEITAEKIDGKEADEYFASQDYILLFNCNDNSYSF